MEITKFITSIRNITNSYHGFNSTAQKTLLYHEIKLQRNRSIYQDKTEFLLLLKYKLRLFLDLHYPYYNVNNFNILAHFIDKAIESQSTLNKFQHFSRFIYDEEIPIENMIKKFEENTTSGFIDIVFSFLHKNNYIDSSFYNSPILHFHYKKSRSPLYESIMNSLKYYYINHNLEFENSYEQFKSYTKTLECLNILFFLFDKLHELDLTFFIPYIKKISDTERLLKNSDIYKEITLKNKEFFNSKNPRKENIENIISYFQTFDFFHNPKLADLLNLYPIVDQDTIIFKFPASILKLNGQIYKIKTIIRRIEGGNTLIDREIGWPLNTYLKLRCDKCVIMVFKKELETNAQKFKRLIEGSEIEIVAKHFDNHVYHFKKFI